MKPMMHIRGYHAEDPFQRSFTIQLFDYRGGDIFRGAHQHGIRMLRGDTGAFDGISGKLPVFCGCWLCAACDDNVGVKPPPNSKDLWPNALQEQFQHRGQQRSITYALKAEKKALDSINMHSDRHTDETAEDG